MHINGFIAGAGSLFGTIVVAITLAVTIGRPLRKLSRQNDEFREDWYGEAARPGVDARAGVMQRLRSIEKELHPNGGATMRDALIRVEDNQTDHARRLDDHLSDHQQRRSHRSDDGNPPSRH